MKGDVCLSHKVTPAVGDASLKEISPSDGGLVIVCLLECEVANTCCSWHVIVATEEGAHSGADCEPHVQRDFRFYEGGE